MLIHGKRVDTVMKELAVFTLVYNLVRFVMLQAAENQGKAADRISFVDTLRWLRNTDHSTELPILIVNPKRPDRFEPRLVKRRPKQYSWMRKPRREIRQDIVNQRRAA